MIKMPLVSIVTVIYKDDPYLPGFLSSIRELEKSNFTLEIIVVQILGSAKILKVPKIRLKQLQIRHRVGYSEAVNRGISASRGQYLFLPNPDTLVHKSALSKLVTYLEDHQDVGIVAPKVFSMDHPTKISTHDLPCQYFDRNSGRVIQVTASEVAAIKQPQEVYWLCGNGIVLPKQVWQQAKKYDESYFLYWEDADFNLKVRQLGYKSVLIPQAKFFHKGSASVGNTPDQVYYIVRNGRYFSQKYSSFRGRLTLHTNSLLVLISKSIQMFMRRGDRLKTRAFIDGILDFYRQKRGSRG